ncbi:MAG: protein kinase domain-containing protein [Janthinobacterium lividum]
MNSTEPLTQIGKYKILSELGRGGMGVVYRAEDRFIGREVAIKTLVDASPAMRQRFAIEARSGVLNHPNIVTIYDFGEHEDSPYIVMEFLHGRTLERIIKEDHPLALVEKLDIVRQVCEGLGYAHARGVVHRDIKPANVVLLQNGVVKLVDFGIAQLETLSGHTAAGSVIGTYQYLSPERLKGEASDGRGDIWSAGVLLYLLLTGTLPFPGEDISALHRVITDPYPPLGSLLSIAYPESLDNIIARALEKDPKQRYGEALEMAGDLETIRDSIRLSRIEDLLGQARTLIARDELLRARPLLLDLQRLAPQNTAVRNMLRELGERLKQQPELRAAIPTVSGPVDAPAPAQSEAAASNGHAPAHGGATQDAQELAAMHEEERRRIIIEQIVAEIRTQAERGNEARALELVHRSLQRAPGNAALLALQREVQARIGAAQHDAVRLETSAPEMAVAPEETKPAAAAVAPLPPEVEPAPELIAYAADEAAQGFVTQETAAEAPVEPEQRPAGGIAAILSPATLAASVAETVALHPETRPAAMEADEPATHPVAEAAAAIPPAVVETTPDTPQEASPAVAPKPVELPESKVNPAPSAKPIESPEPTPVDLPTPEIVAPPASSEATQRPAPTVVPMGPVVVATPERLAAAEVSGTRRTNRSSVPLVVGVVVVLLALFFVLALRYRNKPAPLPSTYAEIIASPYAQVLRITTAEGSSVALAPGDHTTPLRVNDLPPGAYTVDLQAPGFAVTQTRCSVDAGQHLCLVVLEPLSDANIQEILQGGPRP